MGACGAQAPCDGLPAEQPTLTPDRQKPTVCLQPAWSNVAKPHMRCEQGVLLLPWVAHDTAHHRLQPRARHASLLEDTHAARGSRTPHDARAACPPLPQRLQGRESRRRTPQSTRPRRKRPPAPAPAQAARAPRAPVAPAARRPARAGPAPAPAPEAGAGRPARARRARAARPWRAGRPRPALPGPRGRRCPFGQRICLVCHGPYGAHQALAKHSASSATRATFWLAQRRQPPCCGCSP